MRKSDIQSVKSQLATKMTGVNIIFVDAACAHAPCVCDLNVVARHVELDQKSAKVCGKSSKNLLDHNLLVLNVFDNVSQPD